MFTPTDGVLEIELEGALAGMLAAASPKAEAEDLERTVKMVAGAYKRRDLANWRAVA